MTPTPARMLPQRPPPRVRTDGKPGNRSAVPDVAQFDHESAFSGGTQPWALGQVVRRCLSMGIDVLCRPCG